jgi:hypothetical protein
VEKSHVLSSGEDWSLEGRSKLGKVDRAALGEEDRRGIDAGGHLKAALIRR